MVVCKYYRQGNCRYGQYCQFEHINTFASTNKTDSYNEDEILAVSVAKEVLMAERGGQWMLSCFVPIKEKPCIPGMEDVSPEEIRWEMYQAQKTGMVEQAKLHFQQLCQDIKGKRDALKNPTRDTIAMLKKLLGGNQKGRITTTGNTAAKSSAFAFATPQLGLPTSSTASNVFGNKTFGTQSNPFTGGFTSSSNASLFSKTTTTTNPIFGGTPAFGNNLGGFGTPSNTSSLFGGTTNTSTFNTVQNNPTFGTTAPQNNPTFGTTAPQNNPIFGGGSTQTVFGQSTAFGGTNQTSNIFGRPQTSQATSVFNSGPTTSSLPFNTPVSSFPFGTPATNQNAFGTTASTGSFSTGIFSQSKPAFGGAPVFGGGTSFSNNTGSMFGGQSTFGTPAVPTSNIFGASNPQTSVFSSTSQPTNTFGTTVSSSNTNIFGNTQSTGTIMSVAHSTPFGTNVPPTSTPFASAASQFSATNTTATPFQQPSFGLPAASTGETFGTTVTSSSAPFGTANTGVAFGTSNASTSPFTTSHFGEAKSSPFAPTNTTITTTTSTTNSNPFAPKTQQTSSPFGSITQTDPNSTAPFGKSPFGTTIVSAIIDDSIYTLEGQLTDDEKSMYLAEKFTFGKIPLKPPTKDIR